MEFLTLTVIERFKGPLKVLIKLKVNHQKQSQKSLLSHTRNATIPSFRPIGRVHSISEPQQQHEDMCPALRSATSEPIAILDERTELNNEPPKLQLGPFQDANH